MEIHDLIWKVVTPDGIEPGEGEIPPDAISVYSIIEGDFEGSNYRTIETIMEPGMTLEDLLAEVEEVILEWEEQYGPPG